MSDSAIVVERENTILGQEFAFVKLSRGFFGPKLNQAHPPCGPRVLTPAMCCNHYLELSLLRNLPNWQQKRSNIGDNESVGVAMGQIVHLPSCESQHFSRCVDGRGVDGGVLTQDEEQAARRIYVDVYGNL
ncbi:unnamed protein product [Fusarium venenatum]|uniref:Uncharacterized protein n=1 Tax=Fusarium venenatum TaxID=56646 RepID=A0A2L2T8X4_9HYPO|nr:uncharacterized protein FVRRES_03874 [Fusarium venenatum]CEI67362.1 unnamed protein product [Fusarium venenatum]